MTPEQEAKLDRLIVLTASQGTRLEDLAQQVRDHVNKCDTHRGEYVKANVALGDRVSRVEEREKINRRWSLGSGPGIVGVIEGAKLLLPSLFK